jgi:diguanylate cyclase (GGDEF)-like protein
VSEPWLPSTVRAFWRDAGAAWRDLDPATLSPRIAAVIYLAAGALCFVVMPFTSDGIHSATLLPIAIAAASFGAVALVLPWQRWPRRAQVVFAMFAFVLFAWGGLLAAESAGPYLAVMPLPFVFVGFTQRPGTCVALAPLAAVSLVVAARFSFDPSLAGVLLFALPISVLVGEMIAQAERQRSDSEHHIERLLDAVRVLARVEDERAGARKVAALAAELLGAQAVSVLLADRPNGRRYLNRAFFGHPALGEAAPLVLDACAETGLLNGGTRFVGLKRSKTAVRAAAIVPLPDAQGHTVGLVVAMWGTPRRRLNATAAHAAELLSQEAGRMFQRLRDSAALAHDAQTDPLTQLANRRTFSRALQTLQPGDALVIVDLDHFKKVNDRYGHQVGDETLRSLAQCLRETARQVDCVARFGGEEFALVLAGSGAEGATSLMQRVRATWRRTDPITTFSAGIAVHDSVRSPRETLRIADAALYDAKDSGRDRDVLAPETEVALP